MKLLSNSEIIGVHEKVVSLLKGDRKYGAFNAVRWLVGPRVANMLHESAKLPSPGHPTIVRSVSGTSAMSMASSSKRMLDDGESDMYVEDSDMEIFEGDVSFSSKGKRRRVS